MRRLAPRLLAALFLAGCPTADATLVVEVLTNYRAGVDFDGAVVAVYRGDDPAAVSAPIDTGARVSVGLRPGAPTPFRAGELGGLPAGSHLVVARLYRGDAEVARGRVLVTTTDGARSVTVLVTSECDGVACPGSGDPALSACLAGRCVDPRCGPEATEFCPAPECAADADCAVGGPDCVRGLCLSGACVSFADDERCAGGPCDRALGCVGETMDAGAEDAGADDGGLSDAGTDAGVDAGVTTPPFVEVAAGVDHTCARTAAGDVWCWGANAYRQLGDGTATRRLRPTPVPGLTGVDQLGLGWRFSCARTGGQVQCWGWSEWGQAGAAGGTVGAPSAIGGLTGMTVDGLAVGDNQGCARTGGGDVRCWGRGDQGQRGDGGTLLIGPSAVRFRSPEASVGVGAGQLHSCAIGESGVLRCAGRNGEGQLGDGTTTRPTDPVEALVASVVAVDGGFSHTCALHGASRRVACFGVNTHGELGDGSFDERTGPEDIPGLVDVLELSVGWGHACARRASGLLCWGRNDEGQVGDGTNMDRATPVTLAETASITQVSAGGRHTCGLRSDGVVLCWGDNAEGQLGDGTTAPRSTPGPVL